MPTDSICLSSSCNKAKIFGESYTTEDPKQLAKPEQDLVLIWRNHLGAKATLNKPGWFGVEGARCRVVVGGAALAVQAEQRATGNLGCLATKV